MVITSSTRRPSSEGTLTYREYCCWAVALMGQNTVGRQKNQGGAIPPSCMALDLSQTRRSRRREEAELDLLQKSASSRRRLRLVNPLFPSRFSTKMSKRLSKATCQSFDSWRDAG